MLDVLVAFVELPTECSWHRNSTHSVDGNTLTWSARHSISIAEGGLYRHNLAGEASVSPQASPSRSRNKDEKLQDKRCFSVTGFATCGRQPSDSKAFECTLFVSAFSFRENGPMSITFAVIPQASQAMSERKDSFHYLD